MAENAKWLIEQHGADAKMVLWAHNAHVAVETDTLHGSAVSMGYHLRSEYGEDLLVAGFDFYVGKFRAVPSDGSGVYIGGAEPFDAQPPPPKSSAWYFHGSRLQRFILDLRGVNFETVATSWLGDPLKMRRIGALYQLGNPDVHFYDAILPSQFDVIIYFDHTAATRALRFRYPTHW
jgi:erythromycin esterase